MWYFLGLIGIVMSVILFPFFALKRIYEWYERVSKERAEVEKKKNTKCNYKGCNTSAFDSQLRTCHTCHLQFCFLHSYEEKYFGSSNNYCYCKYHYDDYKKVYEENLALKRESERQENERKMEIKLRERKYLEQKKINPAIKVCYEHNCFETHNLIKCKSCDTYFCKEHDNYDGECYSCWDSVNGD